MNELKTIYASCLDNNRIDPSLYAAYSVKQGLRNENGTGVKVGLTKICDVVGYTMEDGKKIGCPGRLIYRGCSLQDLANKQYQNVLDGYERTAFLLIFGKLPNEEELAMFSHALKTSAGTKFIEARYPAGNLLNMLQIEVLKLYGLDDNPDNDGLEDRMLKGISIMSSLPLFVFSGYHHQKIDQYPDVNASLAENILRMARPSQNVSWEEAKVLDTLLVAHADHGGGNNSTFANVVISSTGTDIYSCISASIGSLKGPRHGGAAEKCARQNIELIKRFKSGWTQEKLQDYARDILDKKAGDKSGLIYGMGHAIYTLSDPRAKLIQEQCRHLAPLKGMEAEMRLLEDFEQAAASVLKERKGRNVCANVDYYSGFAYSMLGIDTTLFTPMFAVARSAGWVAHHLENRQSNRKLIRPANIYIGK